MSDAPHDRTKVEDDIYATEHVSEAAKQRDLINGRRYETAASWEQTNTTNEVYISNESDNDYLFVAVEIFVGGPHRVTRSDNPTVDTVGTELTVRNLFDSSVPADITVEEGTTVTDTGDEYESFLIGSGDTPNTYENSLSRTYNVIIQPNNSVYWQLENISGKNQNVSVNIIITRTPQSEV